MVMQGLGSPSLLVRLVLDLHPLVVTFIIMSYMLKCLVGERVAIPVLLLVTVAIMLLVLMAMIFGPSSIYATGISLLFLIVMAVARCLRAFMAWSSRLSPPKAIPLTLEAIAMSYCKVRLPEITVATAAAFVVRVAIRFPLSIAVILGPSSTYRQIQRKERLSPASRSRRVGRRLPHRSIRSRSAALSAGPPSVVLLPPWAMAIP